MNYEKCYNCGADYGLHQSETEACPLFGIEETREGHKQRWAETKFLDMTTRKRELASLQLLDAVQDCLDYFEEWNGHGNHNERIEKLKQVIEYAGGSKGKKHYR